jgi:archaellum component FlaD/FlaE
MSEGYAKIAEGLKMMAAGYELLAEQKQDVAQDTAEEAKAPVVDTTTEPVKETPKKAEKKAEPVTEKKVDVKDVRAVMREKIKDGKMEECQEVLHSFGFEKLTDVPEDRLAELLSKVEVL